MHSKKILIAICSVVAVATVSHMQATTLVVDPTGTYTTIQSAYTAAASSGDTILLLAGYTYTGTGNVNLTFAKDFTLGRTGVGADPIIDMQSVSGQRFCTIDTTHTVTMSNLVIQNGNIGDFNNGGAIANNGTLTALSCTFSNNYTNHYAGAISNGGILGITDCTFSNNTANGTGGAIWSWNSGTINAINCTFSNNTSIHQGGGAISNDGTSIISCCRFIDNNAATADAIYNYAGTVTAENCWWGTNDPTAIAGSLFYGAVDYDPWIQMSLNVVQPAAGLADLTVTFSPACLPDGTPVAFSTSGGYIVPIFGTTLNSTITAQAYDFYFTQTVCAIAEPTSLSPVRLCETVQGSLQPLPPANVQAKQQIHRFPRCADIVNTITWQKAENEEAPVVVSYAIYAAPNFDTPIAIINANAPLRFVAHQEELGVSYTYYLYAISTQGIYSDPVEVTLP